MKDMDGSILRVYSNGEINYTLKGVHARVKVTWNYAAPEGTGDTHYSMMRGSRCQLEIKQGEREGYQPTLYIIPTAIDSPVQFHRDLDSAFQQVEAKYPGISFSGIDEFTWRVDIPENFKVGHEAHFGQVTENFLDYISGGTLPDWEIPNMIVKYYTTTEALKQAFDMK